MGRILSELSEADEGRALEDMTNEVSVTAASKTSSHIRRTGCLRKATPRRWQEYLGGAGHLDNFGNLLFSKDTGSN